MVLCVWQSTIGNFEYDWVISLLPSDSIIINETEKAEKYPNTPCIFVTSYWFDFKEMLNDVKHPFGIIYIAEEDLSDKIDYFISNPLCQFVWRNYVHPKYLKNSIVKFFCSGYKNKFCSYISEDIKKEYLWSFSGAMHHDERNIPIALYKDKLPDSYKVHETPSMSFNSSEGLSTKEYSELIQKSKYVLCPPGKIIFETFRLYEAIEGGAIPITIDIFIKDKPSYYQYLFPIEAGNNPFIITETWEESINIVNKIEETNKYHDILKECKDYWLKCKNYWKKELSNDILKLSKTQFTWKDILNAPSFVINLDRKPQLLSDSLKRIKEAGFTNTFRFPAIDGAHVDLPSIWKIHNNLRFHPADIELLNKKTTPSIQGAMLSHLSLLKKIIDEEINVATIFEDDIIFHKDWKQLAHNYYEITPKDFDMIYMGQHCGNGFNGHVAKDLPVWTLCAFIITLEGAKYLYNKVVNDRNSIWQNLDYIIYYYMLKKHKKEDDYLTWYIWNSEMYPDETFMKDPEHGHKDTGLVFQEYRPPAIN